MVLLGVMLGLCCALGASLAYLAMRVYTLHYRGGTLRLLVHAHVGHGLVCAVLLPLVWPNEVPRAIVLQTLAICGGYMVGQTMVFLALRLTEASRVAPLLGVKIALLAVIAVTWLDQTITPWQWLAVAMTVAAAFVLNFSGGSMPTRAVVFVLLACAGYAVSDTGIQRFVNLVVQTGRTPLHAGLFAMLLSYALMGVLAVLLLPVVGWRVGRHWRDAMPYTAAWFMSMAGFFGCVALLGVVPAGILQATRGILSILLGVLLAKIGLLHLESKVDRVVVLRRLTAAVLIVSAIGLYLTQRSTG